MTYPLVPHTSVPSVVEPSRYHDSNYELLHISAFD